MQTITTKKVADLTSRARKVFGAMESAEASVYRDVKLSCYYAWLFGRVLCSAKDELEHGVFMSWRASTFPKLKQNKTQRCMELHKRNANCRELDNLSEKNLEGFVAKLDADSVRKYQLGYVPEKEKPQLTGRDDAGELTDLRFKRPRSSLKCCNEWAKWKQQRDQGTHGEKSIIQERVDFREQFNWMVQDLYASELITLDDGRKAVIIAD
jgi:hypothetical protein